MEHCVTVCIVPWSFVFSCVTYRHIVPALICSVGTGLNNVPWSFVLDCGTYRQSDLYCSAMGCADGVTHLLICPVGTGFNPRERGLLDKRRTKKSRPEGRQSGTVLLFDAFQRFDYLSAITQCNCHIRCVDVAP